MIVSFQNLRGGLAIGDIEQVRETVGGRLIGAEDTEIAAFPIQFHYVAKERPHHPCGFRYDDTGLGYGNGIIAKVRHSQIAKENPSIRMWIGPHAAFPDRKSTRLNSSHLVISYAVFCL